MQKEAQRPPRQEAVVFAPPQMLKQTPQFRSEFAMSTSQPSAGLPLQSSKPLSQRRMHSPSTHVVVAWSAEQASHGFVDCSHTEGVLNVGQSTGDSHPFAYAQQSPLLGSFAHAGELGGTQFGCGSRAAGQSSQILLLHIQPLPSSTHVQ